MKFMFPCTQCGCCCRRIGLVVNELKIPFPFKVKDNGECEMLENNKCKVYDSRPTICNIDALTEVLGVDKDLFYQENIKACNAMMKADGILKEYRIKD